jgi:hypothetical protein
VAAIASVRITAAAACSEVWTALDRPRDYTSNASRSIAVLFSEMDWPLSRGGRWAKAVGMDDIPKSAAWILSGFSAAAAAVTLVGLAPRLSDAHPAALRVAIILIIVGPL